jgi:dTDP-4-amino-4,6-dideoxygalactose transaminase
MTAMISLITDLFAPEYFGFVPGCDDGEAEGMERVREVLDRGESPKIVAEYERRFAAVTGLGQAVSFAAARMAFYTAMDLLGIGQGDEVLLTGFTCSVMANAVWRKGATPVYADIDAQTFGSDASDITRKITPRTRMIVAQHSFGIPCAIESIAEIARQRGVFLLEDCALSLGSALHGKRVGEWGDAAIFSTDHSKPLNTLTGGILYTCDGGLAARAREYQERLPNLDRSHQERLWRRMRLEQKWFHPRRYALGRLLAKAVKAPARLWKKLGRPMRYALLEADYKPRIPAGSYPYPARFPAFLAQLGVMELERWPAEAERRRKLLKRFLEAADSCGLAEHLPRSYFDESREVVPLRFVYTHPQAAQIAQRMARRVEVDWIWFREPIICAPAGPESFSYAKGSCSEAEKTGKTIINWPCAFPAELDEKLFEAFRAAHRGIA